MSEMERRTIDPAAFPMMDRAKEIGFVTAYERAKAQEPKCTFGNTGICCRLCLQGPCRILTKKPGGDKGVCGAADFTIVARNIVRTIAGGSAAHSDHGRHIAETFMHIAKGEAKDYQITDVDKLMKVAQRLGIATEGRAVNEVAVDVAKIALDEFGRMDGKELAWISSTYPENRLKVFRDTNIMPSNINLSIAQLLHQTHPGNDADPVNIIFAGLKTALCDIAGMSLATDLSDIIFGTGKPVVTKANLGVIKEDQINIAVHGHNPLLSQMVVKAARDMKDEALAAGAKGINLVGICCTGNEVLTREGVAIATNYASQELSVLTGAMDAIVVDVQCIMPTLRTVAECFHTKIITTMPQMKIPGSYHVAFDEAKALEGAREIISLAIDAYKARDPKKINIPDVTSKVVAGFTLEAMLDIFAKVNPEKPIRVLIDAIEAGEIKGVVLFAGCNNLKVAQDASHVTIAKELAKNDVFLVATGCAAQGFAKEGFLNGDGVKKYAGEGLKKFINRLNEKAGLAEELPLVYHMGSCVDNSRAQTLVNMIAVEMDIDNRDLPYIASAPEAMSEKAVSIGSYNVASGNPTHVGIIAPTVGSTLVNDVVTKIAEDVFGGFFFWETDPQKAAAKMVDILNERNWKNKMRQKAASAKEAAEAAAH